MLRVGFLLKKYVSTKNKKEKMLRVVLYVSNENKKKI
jgi:hypothetical protein